MYCKKCGAEIIGGKKFCTRCGAEVLNFKTETNSAGGMSKKTLTLICIIAGVVVAGIITTVIILNSQKSAVDTYMDYAESAVGQYKDAINGIASAAGDMSQAFGESFSTENAQNSNLLNPFEDITVSFSGENGKGVAYIVSGKPDLLSTIYYKFEGTNDFLSNGNEITVVFDVDYFKQYHPEYDVKTINNKYTVYGLTETSLSSSSLTSSPWPEPWSDLYIPGVSSDLYILPDSDRIEYSADYLSTLTDRQLRFARNEISARHGRKYKDEMLQEFFLSKSWYMPLYEADYFDKNLYGQMSRIERHNMDTINKIEDARAKAKINH